MPRDFALVDVDPQCVGGDRNRGVSGAGVQLELPRTLRTQLTTEPKRLDAFRDAVRCAALASLESSG